VEQINKRIKGKVNTLLITKKDIDIKYEEPVISNANNREVSHPNSFLRKYENNINCKRQLIKIKIENPIGRPEKITYGIIKK